MSEKPGRSIIVKRTDFHFLPTRKPEFSYPSIEDGRLSLRDIGNARIKPGLRGYVSVVASVLRGVIIESPNQPPKKIEPLPDLQTKDALIFLAPNESFVLTRKRFARGKTVVVLTNSKGI